MQKRIKILNNAVHLFITTADTTDSFFDVPMNPTYALNLTLCGIAGLIGLVIGIIIVSNGNNPSDENSLHYISAVSIGAVIGMVALITLFNFAPITFFSIVAALVVIFALATKKRLFGDKVK
jgi:hypothetical protein